MLKLIFKIKSDHVKENEDSLKTQNAETSENINQSFENPNTVNPESEKIVTSDNTQQQASV